MKRDLKRRQFFRNFELGDLLIFLLGIPVEWQLPIQIIRI